MSTTPARLASEDVIINAPLSYAGAAQRIFRLRRRPTSPAASAAVTVLAAALVVCAWALVTCWYMTWGLLLVPYRLLRRGSRKRKAEALRHREMLGAVTAQSASIHVIPEGGALEPVGATPLLIESSAAPIVTLAAEPTTEAGAA